MNEARSFETDLYLSGKIAELPNATWREDEKQALRNAANFIKEWTTLRSSILFHLLNSGEEQTEEAQSRIQYWKDVMDGQKPSSTETYSGLSSNIDKNNKPVAEEILEGYRRVLAKDILKKAGALPITEIEEIRKEAAATPTIFVPEPVLKTIEPTPAQSAPKAAAPKKARVTADDITVIEEDYIAEFVANNDGVELDEFYHRHLMPAYKAVFAEMQDKLKNKPANKSIEKFRKENEIFLNHAEFLRNQIKLVREKEPTVDNPIPVLTDIVELGKKPAAIAEARQQSIDIYADEVPLDQDTGMTLPKMSVSSPEPKKPSMLSALGSGLKSLFNTVAKKLLPTPKLGWGLASGAGLAAGVALATVMHTGDVQNHHPKQIQPLASDDAPKAEFVAKVSAPLPSLDAPIVLEAAQPVAKVDVTTKSEAKPTSKLVTIATKSFAKPAPVAEPSQTESVATAPAEEAKPLEAQEFDIATFRQDLSTLEKACRQVGSQVGKSTPDGVCNGLQPL